MSRYVDIEGDWVDDAIKAYSLGYYEDDEYAIPIERFDSAPTIDIVRCRECKHKYQEPWNNGVAVEGECEIWHNATLDDDYCSYGERGENE